MNQHIQEQYLFINQQIKELTSIYHLAANLSKISDNEMWIWYALLLFNEECTQQEICEMWSLPKQTVNTVISNLAKKEYLYLEPAQKNRKIIHLTESGKTYGKSVLSKIYQSEINVLEKFEETERKDFIRLLGKYITYLKEEICEE